MSVPDSCRKKMGMAWAAALQSQYCQNYEAVYKLCLTMGMHESCRKKMEVSWQQLDPRLRGVDGLDDIMRFDLQHFCRRMQPPDEPHYWYTLLLSSPSCVEQTAHFFYRRQVRGEEDRGLQTALPKLLQHAEKQCLLQSVANSKQSMQRVVLTCILKSGPCGKPQVMQHSLVICTASACYQRNNA